MTGRMRYVVSLLTVAMGACGSNSNSTNAGATPAGALPCTGLALDCRTAFSDTYNGTYQGSSSGTFTLQVDVLGGVQGSGPGVTSITGQVDEFGRITFTFDDDTKFTGQFKADRHSIAGTWKSSSGSGTFVAQSATVALGTGGTGAGTGGTGSGPSASTVVTAASQGCQKAATCGLVSASDCPVVDSTTQPDSPQACWDKELAAYQCLIDTACASIQTTCKPAATALETCVSNNPSYPNNPDFNPPLTGIENFDAAVHLCTQCTTEAKACYNLADCKAYVVCVDACPSNDFTCGDNCSTDHADGFQAYSDAATCQFLECT